MGKLVDDLHHLKCDIRHIHEDVEHLSRDLQTLAEHTAPDPGVLPSLTDLRDHLQDLDSHTHDVLSHVTHVETELAGREGMAALP
ncbi:MAG: hypothetical protein JXB25_05545 [Deltaproteobacteria bacterium]|nr:hypothetical protein [Deltaproteobacteria bacterium]